MTYTCNDKVYVAESLEGAWLKALTEQGVDAMVHANVKGDNGNFACYVCLGAYRRAFPQFSDEDFLQYEIVNTRAWLEFPTETFFDYYEECEVTSLCDKGIEFIRANSSLARYMDEIGFRW